MTASVTAVAGAAFAALVLSDLLCETLRRLALRRGLVDRPSARKAHRRATPYLGGVAIAVGSLASGCALVPHWDRRLGVVVAASVVVALVGLSDDVRPVHPAFRLVPESVAAAAVVACGGRIAVFGGWPDAVLTVAWIVVLTNSFNLLDNMDGAAAMVAVAAAFLVAAAAYLAGQTGFGLLLTALSAACLGFLVHNWAPARMFMGDAGSLFVGFWLSATTVLLPVRGGPVDRIAELLLFTFVATVDTCLVVIARPRAGRSCFTAGTDHASHRLHLMGLSVRQVGLALFAVTAVACLSGIAVVRGWLPGAGVLATAVAAAVAGIAVLLRVPAYGGPVEAVPAMDTVETVDSRP